MISAIYVIIQEDLNRPVQPCMDRLDGPAGHVQSGREAIFFGKLGMPNKIWHTITF